MLGGYAALRETIDQLYESGVFPPVDLYVADRDVILEVALPGVDPEDVQISATSTSVTISGEIKPETGIGQSYIEGIWRGRFGPTLTLPVPVDASRGTAQFRNGILTLTLPKVAADTPYTIQISGADGAAADGGQAKGSGVPVTSR
jgi:HSP20 family protein